MSMEALYVGDAKWVWVIHSDNASVVVSDWDGNERTIDARDYDITPDLERDVHGHRHPVHRTIGTGKRAQYMRIERRRAA